MLRDVLVATIAKKLGDRTDLDDAIIAEMQMTQEFRLEQGGKFQPWFMITEDSTILTQVNEPRIALPANFVAEVEESGLWYLNEMANKWTPLVKTAEDEGRYYIAGTGAPQYYSVIGDRFTLHPTPDAVYTLRMRYAAKQPALTTNIENNWLKYASDLVMFDVCQHIAAENLQNDKLSQTFAVHKLEAWERLFIMHESRQHTNQEYRMGG